MTAELERRKFGCTLPMHWWDQPLARIGETCLLGTLIDAACVEISRLSAEFQGRADLLASSFGAYLARALVDRMPERVGSITICGGVWDLCTRILRLGWHFAWLRGDADLEAACRQAAQVDTPEAYFGLFARVSAMPVFLDCGWKPSAPEVRTAMKSLAAEARLID